MTERDTPAHVTTYAVKTLFDPPPLWAIVPALDLVEMTLDTCRDLLSQSLETRVLLIDQGSSEASNDQFRAFAELHHPRVLLWSFTVPLPSLSAAWNRGLAFVWALGGESALVCNSDIRLHRDTAKVLSEVCWTMTALFVSALGVGADQFHPEAPTLDPSLTGINKGGPDFSCFLITQRAHVRYPFDEGFIPAFSEDCDAHRRYMLGGDGDNIFSINLPFHHIKGGSRTINQSPEARAKFERQASIGRAHYVRKWGGPPNAEVYVAPFDPVWPLRVPRYIGVTNPELQARVQAGLPPLAVEIPVAERELTGPEEIAEVERVFEDRMRAIRQREAEDHDRAFPSTPESFPGSDF